jgi:hypothetical protein
MRLLITVLAFSIASFSADNSLGTWKRNTEKSKSNPPLSNAVKSLTMVREANGPDGVKVTNTGVRGDGTPINWSYTAKYDGKENRVAGNGPFDMVSIKQLDPNTFTITLRKEGGKFQATGRSVVSKDGKLSLFRPREQTRTASPRPRP